jgi:hypothetical protein
MENYSCHYYSSQEKHNFTNNTINQTLGECVRTVTKNLHKKMK